MRQRRIVSWAGTLLGLCLIVFLLVRYDPAAVLQALLDSNPVYLLAVALLLSAIQLLNALGPTVLLGPSALPGVSTPGQARAFLATQPLALVAPGKISDLGAIPLLGYAHPPGAVASSILLDRLVTLFFLLLSTPVALRLAGVLHASITTDIAVVVGLALVGSTPLLLIDQRIRGMANRYVLRHWPTLLRGFGAHVEGVLRTSRHRLFANFGLTALKTALSAGTIAILAADMNVAVGFWLAIWMSVLVQLVSSIPVSAQGLGLAEGTLVALFRANGLPGAPALAIALVSRVLLIGVMGIVYMAVTLPMAAHRLAGGSGAPADRRRSEP